MAEPQIRIDADRAPLRGIIRWAEVRAQVDVINACGEVLASTPTVFPLKTPRETDLEFDSLEAAWEHLDMLRVELPMRHALRSGSQASTLNIQPSERPAWLRLLIHLCLPFFRG